MTLCASGKKCLFGEAVDGAVRLNIVGDIVRQCWLRIPEHFGGITLDEYIVMPNHIHGILAIGRRDEVGQYETGLQFRQRRAWHAKPLQEMRFGRPGSATIGTIIGSFKAAVSKEVRLKTGKAGTTIWQRNYYEHIISSQSGLDRIRRYIMENPVNWGTDEENPGVQTL